LFISGHICCCLSTSVGSYRAGQSIETALLCIFDSVYSFIDKKQLTVLIGLDISAVFNTISHNILLQRLNYVFCVSDKILDWFYSYLDNHHQYIQLGRDRSPTVLCSFDVPQGGVLSALLFIAYVAPVSDVISSCGMDYHHFADDTHLFIKVQAKTIQSNRSVVDTCTKRSSPTALWSILALTI